MRFAPKLPGQFSPGVTPQDFLPLLRPDSPHRMPHTPVDVAGLIRSLGMINSRELSSSTSEITMRSPILVAQTGVASAYERENSARSSGVVPPSSSSSITSTLCCSGQATLTRVCWESFGLGRASDCAP